MEDFPLLLPDLEPNLGEAHGGGKYTGGERASYSVCVIATGPGRVPLGTASRNLQEEYEQENSSHTGPTGIGPLARGTL